MRQAKPISKEMCLDAMNKTRSIKAAARYLSCSYQHLKPYMKMYIDENSGKSLFEIHKNQAGKGIYKYLRYSPKKQLALSDLMEGKIDSSHYDPQKIKFRLFEEGFLKEECGVCGFHDRRLLDYKVPVLLHFKDENRQNYKLTNLEILCYNCYFLICGDIFNKKDIISIEGKNDVNSVTIASDFQMDDYHIQRLKDIGMWGEDNDEDDSPYSLVSRKK
jgi:hypothetical protein